MADQKWFAGLYRSCYRQLVLAGHALTDDLGEGRKFTQEAFALADGRRAQVAAADSPQAWLRTVTVNLARRRWRRRAAPTPGPSRNRASDAPGEHADLHRATQQPPMSSARWWWCCTTWPTCPPARSRPF